MVTRTRALNPALATIAGNLVRMAYPAYESRLNESLHRAIDKAEQRLVQLPWTIESGVLVITSHTHPGEVHLTDGDTCDCATMRGICWHRAAWMLLSAIFATGAAVEAPLPLPAAYYGLDEEPEVARGAWYKGFYYTGEELEKSRQARESRPFNRDGTPRRSVVHQAEPGSELARLQALADEMFAA